MSKSYAAPNETIVLKPFEAFKARQQSKDIRGLLGDSAVAAMIAAERPQTAERYRDRMHAFYNVMRLANTEGFLPFLVCHNRFVKGLATAIPGQTIVHPTEGQFHGTSLDYWLAPNMSDFVHQNVASALRRISPDKTCFATMHPGENHGFRSQLRIIGEPALLTVEGPDTFGIVDPEHPLQLFVGQKLVDRTPDMRETIS